VHVIDADHCRHALEMIGDGCARRPEIKALVGNSSPQIELAREKETMGVGERILNGVLLAKTSVPMQVAFENVGRLQVKEIARDRFRLLLQGWGRRNDVFRAGAAERSEKNERPEEVEACGVFHPLGS
jgi:hypothetical protein